MEQNTKLVMSSLYPSGGVYKWPYTIDPNTTCMTGCLPDYDNLIWTYQMIHEARVEPIYSDMQKYRINGEAKI